MPHDDVQYTDCFVAFIDILGFKDLVKQSRTDPSKLSALIHVLNTVANLPSGTKETRMRNTEGILVERKYVVQTRSFSDSVVIFMPVESGGIDHVLLMLRYLHDRILEMGFCMRGAVTIGGMYWDPEWGNPTSQETSDVNPNVLYQRNGNSTFPITLGPGLIDAYLLESECAVYPRVLIAPILKSYIEDNGLGASPLSYSRQELLSHFIKTDADGLHYFDLLNPQMLRSDTERIVRREDTPGSFSITWERDGNTIRKVLTNTRALITRSLAQTVPENIRAKYEWLRTYARRALYRCKKVNTQ